MRFLLPALAISVVAAILAGCGTSEEKPAAPAAAPASAPAAPAAQARTFDEPCSYLPQQEVVAALGGKIFMANNAGPTTCQFLIEQSATESPILYLMIGGDPNHEEMFRANRMAAENPTPISGLGSEAFLNIEGRKQSLFIIVRDALKDTYRVELYLADSQPSNAAKLEGLAKKVLARVK